MTDPLAALEGGLVVSVQAPEDSPLRETSHMVAIARAAHAGGAAGVRAEGGADIAAIGAAVALPLAAGALLGALVNYAGSAWWVFRPKRHPTS